MSAHSHSHDNIAPKGAIALAAALVIFVLLLTVSVRLGLIAPTADAQTYRAERNVRPVAERVLRFEDTVTRAVRITDAASGAEVASLKGEGAGFVRGVLRGLSRDRQSRGLGGESPYRLTRWADGELTLTDLATGRRIELVGFGSTNTAAFARLLQDPRA